MRVSCVCNRSIATTAVTPKLPRDASGQAAMQWDDDDWRRCACECAVENTAHIHSVINNVSTSFIIAIFSLFCVLSAVLTQKKGAQVSDDTHKGKFCAQNSALIRKLANKTAHTSYLLQRKPETVIKTVSTKFLRSVLQGHFLKKSTRTPFFLFHEFWSTLAKPWQRFCWVRGATGCSQCTSSRQLSRERYEWDA